MFKTNEIYGRRSSYAPTETHAEIVFDNPLKPARKISKPDSRNVNPSNLYGRRSESVTSSLEGNKAKLPYKEHTNGKTMSPASFGNSLKVGSPVYHNIAIRKVQSKRNLNDIYKNSMPKDINQKKVLLISTDKLREEIKSKDTELSNLKSVVKSVEDQLRPLNYSINSLKAFIQEYQELHQTQISMTKEIKTLKEKCIEAEQQLKFVESMEQTKHVHIKLKKNQQNSPRKTPFEKIDSLLSNLNVHLYQLNDVICCDEFLESVLSVKVEKEAEEIAIQHNEKRDAISEKSKKDASDDESKQRIEIDSQTLEFLKKSAIEQVDSIKNGYTEMRDCWKLYFSFMRSFLEIYAGDNESESRDM